MSQLNFNATQVEPSTTFEPVPAGWYNCIISDSESKIAKSGNGEYLQLEFSVLDGPYANRKFRTILNLWNDSSQAVEIAQRDLSAICHAIGVAQVGDSAELHNKPLQVKVTVEENGSYGPQNRVKGYKAAGGAAPPPPRGATMAPPPSAGAGKPSTQASPASPASGASTPPWQRQAS